MHAPGKTNAALNLSLSYRTGESAVVHLRSNDGRIVALKDKSRL
jgi:hypothetical protein